MTEFYKELLQKGIFSKNVISSALEFGKSLDLEMLSKVFFEQETDEEGVFYPQVFFENATKQIKERKIAIETGYLYIYICFLPRAYELFLNRDIDKNVFFNTVKRLSESAVEYKNETGKDGFYDYHFLANHVKGSVLRLGEFEYGFGLYNGEKSIVMHIPNGANLKKRYESYKMAHEFFGGYRIILDSWLLYPEHKKMLPENSDICHLMEDFDIINVNEHYDYTELFHIFGRDGKIKTNTTLQKKYAERVENKKPVGSAFGILKSLEKSDEK